MSTFKLEKGLDKVTNRYRTVVIAAKRAREIIEKNLELETGSSFKKASSIALEEFLQGKLKYNENAKKK